MGNTKRVSATMDELLSQESLDIPHLERGNVLVGQVISVGERDALIDLGTKWEGVLPLREVEDEDLLSPGKEMLVYVITPHDRRGQVILSAKKAKTVNAWEKLEAAFEEGEVFDVKLTGFNKGGGLVDAWGVSAFLPFSQFVSRPDAELHDPEFQSTLDKMRGSKLKVKVIDLSSESDKVIVSEREAIKEEQAEKEREVLQQLKEGEIIDAQIREILPYGLLVEFGGVEALIPTVELSWREEKEELSSFRKGQGVKAKVIEVPEGMIGRAKLSIKRLREDPWQELAQLKEEGKDVMGDVVKVASFGVVIELEQGLEGLIPLAEVSDGMEIQVGDKLKLKLKEVKPKEKRLELQLG